MILIELGADGLSWDGWATIIAAVAAAAVAVGGYFLQRHFSRQHERRTIYAEALRAVHDYLEGPYLVRRRLPGPAGRVAVARHLSEVQSRLNYYSDLLRLQGPTEVADIYATAVSTAREEAGQQMKGAWRKAPIRRDAQMSLRLRFPQPRSEVALADAVRAMGAASSRR